MGKMLGGEGSGVGAEEAEPLLGGVEEDMTAANELGW